MDSLEQEIAQIEQNLAAKRAALEQQKSAGEIQELPPEKETLRQIVGQQIHETTPPAPMAPPPTQSAEEPSYMNPVMNNSVRLLIDMAFKQSVDNAIKSVKKTGNAALIDAFHDALVDELYDSLLEYRKLKKV